MATVLPFRGTAWGRSADLRADSSPGWDRCPCRYCSSPACWRRSGAVRSASSSRSPAAGCGAPRAWPVLQRINHSIRPLAQQSVRVCVSANQTSHITKYVCVRVSACMRIRPDTQQSVSEYFVCVCVCVCEREREGEREREKERERESGAEL